MEFSKLMLLCLLLPAFQSAYSAPTCQRDFRTFLRDLNSQCPFSVTFSGSPIQVNVESFERAMSSIQKNEYTAVLFYASWCPFSSVFLSKFSTLSSMYPQIKHLMVEQSSFMPSIFSRYGIHSVPSLLIVNQTNRIRYYAKKDLRPLVNFYKQTTGMDPIEDVVEETSSNSENDPKLFQFWAGVSLKETFSKELYLVLSITFVLLRASLYFLPKITSRITAMWVAYIPHVNLEIFGESRQLLGRMLNLIDVKRIWSKIKLCKTRNFQQGARNARVWASSLASVSLGETLSSRVFPTRDL